MDSPPVALAHPRSNTEIIRDSLQTIATDLAFIVEALPACVPTTTRLDVNDAAASIRNAIQRIEFIAAGMAKEQKR